MELQVTPLVDRVLIHAGETRRIPIEPAKVYYLTAYAPISQAVCALSL